MNALAPTTDRSTSGNDRGPANADAPQASPGKNALAHQAASAAISPQTKFVSKYGKAAVELENKDGVPALFTLAQGALESGWGRSAIGNALFGIKADASWKGKKQLVTTTEFFSDDKQGHRFPEVISITPSGGKFKYVVKDWFRDYETAEEGLADHSSFLLKNKRYAPAFNTESPEAFATAIAKAGYATDPGYAETLKSVIRTVRSHWSAELGPIPAGNAKAKTGGTPPAADGKADGAAAGGATAAGGAAAGGATAAGGGAAAGPQHEAAPAAHAKHPAPAIDGVRGGKDVLSLGMQGASVGYVQQKLGMQGKAVDSDFGPLTEAAVKKFQQTHGLATDGVIGTKTLLALDGGAQKAGTPASANEQAAHVEHESKAEETHARDHEAAAKAKADVSPQAKFVAKYGHGAIALENKDGVPALFTLGQAALESGWGKSAIGNALFGIKAGAGWTGKKQLVTTTEYFADDKQGHRFPEVISITPVTTGKNEGKFKYTVKDWFRDYETVDDGLADHSAFLMSNKRYAPAFNTETPEAFAMAVAKAGYATAAGYGDTLKSMIATVRSHWAAELGPIPPGNAKAKTGGAPGAEAATPAK
ncbi:MAG TPA: glucosaminidase domain-containing protein [Kofleriaceae bacterium]